MSTLILNIHSTFQLILSLIFFVIILFALFPKDGGKRNISWLLCAISFFVAFILQFLNALAPSSIFSAKIMVLVGYNISALSFLYPYCITKTMFETIRNNRIYLAVIFILCCIVSILHYFNLVITNPTLRPPLGYYATPGPYNWVLLFTLGISFIYDFFIILRMRRLSSTDVNQKKQHLWIFLGTIFLLIAVVIQTLIVYDVNIPRVGILVWIFFAIAIGYSVFRHSVFGFSGIAISTVSSMIVGTLFVMAHHIIIKLIEKWIIVYLSLRESEYISVATAFVLIIFVQPLYITLHHKLGKIFQL